MHRNELMAAGCRIPRPRWLSEPGPFSEVVVSTRCRFARNLVDLPFPWKASELQRKVATERLTDAAHRGGGALARAEPVRAEWLGAEELSVLLTWRYASRAWAEEGSYRRLLAGADGCTSLLLNEEDHLRLQVILPGLQVESAYRSALAAERAMAQSVQFAYKEGIGWLTASLANAGTGMRVSALLHLPALARTGLLRSHLEAAEQTGCSLRGLYGEGSHAGGDVFQVSNRRAFGIGETEIAAQVRAAASFLANAELEQRLKSYGHPAGNALLAADARETIQGINERDWLPEELLEQVSLLRLAVAMKAIPGSLATAAEWIAIAGAAVQRLEAGRETQRYESIRRSAELRRRLRALMQESGTFHS